MLWFEEGAISNRLVSSSRGELPKLAGLHEQGRLITAATSLASDQVASPGASLEALPTGWLRRMGQSRQQCRGRGIEGHRATSDDQLNHALQLTAGRGSTAVASSA